MPPTSPEDAAQIREFVQRMGRARNSTTQTYMPAALLAVCDLAERGTLRDGTVPVSDYKLAFKRIMLEVWPEREDFWWRPMLHVTRHRMWTPLRNGQDVELQPDQVSRLQNEKQASRLADAFRLEPVVRDAILDSNRREEVRRCVYSLLADDGEERSSRLADVHAHLDAAADPEHLRDLQEYELRLEARDAFLDLRRREVASRVVRVGQSEFRVALMHAYDRRCCVSGADVPRALDGAHILPYRGQHTNDVTNGLLLRRDLHALFDDGLLTIDVSSTFEVDLHESLANTAYRDMQGRELTLPHDHCDHPDRDALHWHHRKNRG